MRTNNKKLSSQAHAASQLNVQPTKKATTSTVFDNPKNLSQADYIKYLNIQNDTIQELKRKCKELSDQAPLPRIGVRITDGEQTFMVGANYLETDFYELQIKDLSTRCLSYICDNRFDDYNKNITRAMNKIIFLEQQLGDKISPYIYAFGEKKIELKSAYQGLKILLNCGDGDFEVYKDAIASCVFAIANTQSDDLLFNEKKAVGDLHALYNFFCDLQKDVKGIEE